MMGKDNCVALPHTLSPTPITVAYQLKCFTFCLPLLQYRTDVVGTLHGDSVLTGMVSSHQELPIQQCLFCIACHSPLLNRGAYLHACVDSMQYTERDKGRPRLQGPRANGVAKRRNSELESTPRGLFFMFSWLVNMPTQNARYELGSRGGKGKNQVGWKKCSSAEAPRGEEEKSHRNLGGKATKTVLLLRANLPPRHRDTTKPTSPNPKLAGPPNQKLNMNV